MTAGGDRVRLGNSHWYRNLGGQDVGVTVKVEGNAVSTKVVVPTEFEVGCGIHPGVRYAGTASGYSDDALAIVPRLYEEDSVRFQSGGDGTAVATSRVTIPAGFAIDRDPARVSTFSIDVSRNADVYPEIFGVVGPGASEAMVTMTFGDTSCFVLTHRLVFRVPGPGVTLPRRPFEERRPLPNILQAAQEAFEHDNASSLAAIVGRLREYAATGNEVAYETEHAALMEALGGTGYDMFGRMIGLANPYG